MLETLGDISFDSLFGQAHIRGYFGILQAFVAGHLENLTAFRGQCLHSFPDHYAYVFFSDSALLNISSAKLRHKLQAGCRYPSPKFVQTTVVYGTAQIGFHGSVDFYAAPVGPKVEHQVQHHLLGIQTVDVE